MSRPLQVYEKEKGLRVMMKMHGLGSASYFIINYLWFLSLYCVYMIILIAFGSLVNLKIFRLNDYGLQIVSLPSFASSCQLGCDLQKMQLAMSLHQQS